MLEIAGVDVCYNDDIQVLWDVSFRVEPGEIVALVGANGAGKTTSLRTISGVLHPSRGDVWFNGQRISHLEPHQVVEAGISHVPEGRQLFATLTVEENLLVGAISRRARPLRKKSLEEVYGLLPRLSERRNQLAGTLSGGEQQMVAIGRGLMSQPDILILDEPSLGLAPMMVNLVFDVAKRINAQGKTVLIVEQNLYKALSIASRGYVLENGRVVLSGRGADLLKDPNVRSAYLGLPASDVSAT